MKILNGKTTRIALICVLFTLFSTHITHLWADNKKTPINILNYIPSAKAMGMGNAYTALCNDISSIYFNPSGLASIIQKEIYGAYEKPHFNSAYWFAGFGFHERNLGTFAFAINYLGRNNILDINKDQENSNLPSQLLILAGFGHQSGSKRKNSKPYNLDIGITLKYIQYSFFNHISYGFGFDVGCKLIPKQSSALKNFLFGLAVQNAIKLGDRFSDTGQYPSTALIKDIDDSDLYFPKARFGISYFAFNRTLSLSLDVNKAFFINTPFEFNFGTALKVFKFLELRAGYHKGYAFGMGLDFYSVSFNSGFNNNRDLGFTGQFDMTLKFF